VIAPNYSTFRELFGQGHAEARDGMPAWPGANNIMDTGITAFTNTFPFTIDLAGADDAVAYVDEWHWYLCVPNEGSGNERIQLVRYDTSAYVSRSGRVKIKLTTAGTAELVAHDSTWMDRFFRDVYLYALNVDNEEIYFADMHRQMFAKS
jgi:hypothetical protein